MPKPDSNPQPPDHADPADPVAAYARQKRFSAATLARWQAWPAEDRAALLSLVCDLRCGENHVKDLLDWLTDIARRDVCGVAEVLAGPAIHSARAGSASRNDRLKAVKVALHRLRFPRLTRLEDQVHQAVRALDLGRSMQVSFPPNFEGDELTISMTVRSVDDLRAQCARLNDRLADGGFARLFAALDHVEDDGADD